MGEIPLNRNGTNPPYRDYHTSKEVLIITGYIYKIINIVDGKFYVGSTINFKSRKSHHLADLKGNRHHSIYLQRAFNKYGESNFKFEIIDECDSKSLLMLEQKYIDEADISSGGCYNISSVASNCVLYGEKNGMYGRLGDRNPNYGRKLSEDAKHRMSEIAKLRIRTSETNRKISETKRKKFASGETVPYNKGMKMSDEFKAKISNAKGIEVLSYNKYTGYFIAKYNSAKHAGLDTGIDNSSIIRCCKGKVKTAGDYIWRYKNGVYDNNINIFDMESRPHRGVKPEIIGGL